ncbi:PLP-dependent transferase, partial [Frankia casuarinae]
VFGTTTRLYAHYLDRFGVMTTVVPVTDPAAWARAMRAQTRMLVVESPTNPVMAVADIRYLAELAHAAGALLLVDNTLCTPVFQQPIVFGADLVLHSAGKYIDGQGRCGGGVVAGRAGLISELHGVLRTAGPSLSPFNAWIFLKSLETLPVRMRAHDANTAVVAAWLADQPDVRAVHYTGSADHPQRELVAAQQSGHGGVISFELYGGQQASWSFVDRLELVSNTTNIGDTKSMITHPASTTHGRLTPAQRDSAGVTDGLLRLSVGLEDVEDIVADLARAFAATRPAGARAR